MICVLATVSLSLVLLDSPQEVYRVNINCIEVLYFLIHPQTGDPQSVLVFILAILLANKIPIYDNRDQYYDDSFAYSGGFIPNNNRNKHRGNNQSNQNNQDFKYVDEGYLEQNGIDEHQLKYETLNDGVDISEWDIYRNTKTGELYLYPHEGGQYIGTGVYIS